jgi:hypothetical protein
MTMDDKRQESEKAVANDSPACKVEDCDCPGFTRNPLVSTDCLNCHHDWGKHRR